MIKPFLGFVVLGLLGLSARAQELPSKPSPPFLARLPAETCWRMDFVSSSPALPQAGNPSTETDKSTAVKKEFLVTRSGEVRRELTSWSDGKSTDVWIVKGAAFIKDPISKHYAAYMPQDNPFGPDYPDFPDLSWVDLDHFNKVEMKNGIHCFVYSIGDRKARFPYKSPFPFATDIDLGPGKIWVSIETKLPVAWEEQTGTATYTFNLPASTPALPEECQRVIATIDAYNKRIAGQKMILPP